MASVGCSLLRFTCLPVNRWWYGRTRQETNRPQVRSVVRFLTPFFVCLGFQEKYGLLDFNN